MSDVNGNSSTEEIYNWLNQKSKEIKDLLTRAEANPSDDLLTKAKNILNNAKTLVKEKDKVMSDEGDPNRSNINLQFNQVLNEMEKDVSSISAKNDTNINASMALSQLMNDKTFQEIQEIEKQILYRKFYFPGGIPKLRVVGQGINKKTDDFEYDQSLEGSDPFDHWDPRYLKDYIAVAKQNGFHRNFIYYDGKEFKTMNFSQASEALKKCINWSTSKIDTDGACDKYEIAGIIGGLIYFDKVSSFVEETGLAGGKTSLFNRVYTYNGDLIIPTIEKIANGLIQQSEKNFKNNNFGWMANDNKYAFDSAQFLSKWIELENEYKNYKEKVWKILEGTNALQLCTNNVNVTGNNITIQQEMSCMQTIAGAETGKEETNKVETDDKGHASTETKDENDKETKDENENMNKGKYTNKDKGNEEVNKNEQVDEENNKQPDGNDDGNMTMIYVIFGVIIFVILCAAVFLLMKKPNISKPNKKYVDVDISLNN